MIYSARCSLSSAYHAHSYRGREISPKFALGPTYVRPDAYVYDVTTTPDRWRAKGWGWLSIHIQHTGTPWLPFWEALPPGHCPHPHFTKISPDLGAYRSRSSTIQHDPARPSTIQHDPARPSTTQHDPAPIQTRSELFRCCRLMLSNFERI
jgi:hypothetical protein